MFIRLFVFCCIGCGQCEEKGECVFDDIVNQFAPKFEAARIIKQTTEEVDLIINNAGILGDIHATILEPLNFAEILKVINVNTLGPLRVTNALVDLLLKGEEKCIINITSEAGSIENNNREAWFGYALSKAAVKILDVVSLQLQSEWKNPHQPVYLDLNGERLPW